MTRVPEALARRSIDDLLTRAGWVVADADKVDLIDAENWSAMGTDVKGDAYEGLLAAPARPAGTFTYPQLAGFLFAVATVPELVKPSEWLPLVFNDGDPGARDAAVRRRC
jgi:hypothetical protein